MITNYLSINSDREENLIRIFPGIFLFQVPNRLFDPSYQLVSWHWHEDFQFCLVERGEVCFQTPGSRFPISSGCGIFLNRRLVHKAFAIDDGFLLLLHQFSPGASDCCQRGCFVGCDGSAPFE